MLNIKNISKDALLKEFAKDYKKYYSTKLFEQEGFVRRHCKICGMNFWSIAERDTCDDPVHTKYSFFKEKPVEIGYVEFWKKFAEFFKKNGHEIVKRYPVVSRWRQDLYFTIAGIQDFQRIENGVMNFEYPANPLLVPQICLRFSDTENVGVTGRHLTSFMMANQTSFNYPKEGYWRDKTIELNYNFLTKVLGVDKNSLVYHEDVWAMPDFSEFGPSLEFYSKGAELGNNVFTQFELVNGEVKELKSMVVDVGWGFDRNLWFYTGNDNIYEAVFKESLERVKKKVNVDFGNKAYKKFAVVASELDITERNEAEKEAKLLKAAGISKEEYEVKIKPIQAVYAIMDHTRTLLFAIADGSLPSNIGGGYNLRIILRRCLDFIEKYKLDLDLTEIARDEAKELEELYPELHESLGIFDKVINVERERYNKSKVNARKIIENKLSKSDSIDAKQLKTLYESNGITPDFIVSVASSRGIKVNLPEHAYADIIGGDMVEKKKQPKLEILLPKTLKETKQLYYEFKNEADAKVVFVEGNYLVLDQTPFYPEGGGQLADIGTINDEKVKDVQKIGGVIVHVMESGANEFKKGETVHAIVDEQRRLRLIAHHTATHLISAAARSVLGKHAWQEGAKKGPDKAHIDVAHYDKLSEEELIRIEDMANDWLLNGIKVSAQVMSRGEAEKRYGFAIYQGHGVPSKEIRIITITSKHGKVIDAEACGGLHALGMESIVGLIKIIDSFRLHDGIDRIEFVAGPAALEYFQREHKELRIASNTINTERFELSAKLMELQNEYRNASKDLTKYRDALAIQVAEMIPDSRIIEKELDVPKDMLKKIAYMLTERNENSIVFLKNKEGDLICVSGEATGIDALDYLKKNLHGANFVGGGSKKVAEGKIVK